jgi:DNA-binding MarR family transcriptional regulator
MSKKIKDPKKPEKPEETEEAEEAEEAEEIEEGPESEIDLTDEERAILMEVVKAGEKGVLADEIAKKLKIPVKKVEQILDRFEEEGWFYSEDQDK